MIFDNIIPIYFFAALFVGILCAYAFSPIPEVIIKYPTPDNAGRVVYQDSAGMCYKYLAKEIDCPVDEATIAIHPVQTGPGKREQSVYEVVMNLVGLGKKSP